jgi:hypothetical protein
MKGRLADGLVVGHWLSMQDLWDSIAIGSWCSHIESVVARLVGDSPLRHFLVQALSWQRQSGPEALDEKSQMMQRQKGVVSDSSYGRL